MANVAPTEQVKKVKCVENTVFEIPIQINSDSITLSLPKTAAEFLGIDLSEEKPFTFAVPTSGVIQLIGSQPKVVIPATDLSAFASKNK